MLFFAATCGKCPQVVGACPKKDNISTKKIRSLKISDYICSGKPIKRQK
jgi:hypothetical protein